MKNRTTLLIIAAIAVLFILWGVSLFNGLIAKEESVDAQWANVENVYQRRADLIPNLVSTVKGYADFEQETLTQVIEARAKATSISVDASNLTPEAVAQLLQLKQTGAPIANSKAGLRHLAHWPDATPIRCLAGRLMVMVEPDGTLLSCHQCEVARFLTAEGKPAKTLTEQFQETQPPRGCSDAEPGPAGRPAPGGGEGPYQGSHITGRA